MPAARCANCGFRLPRQLAAQPKSSTRTLALGEAVYADDASASEAARARMFDLDRLIAAKEGEMEQTAAGAVERIQRAQLQVRPTQIEAPEPPATPEPYPPPTEPPVPVPVPEPTPEPSPPPGPPPPIPEPGPEPSPPPQGGSA
jgi:outer membrane biosynthesis protein TonB